MLINALLVYDAMSTLLGLTYCIQFSAIDMANSSPVSTAKLSVILLFNTSCNSGTTNATLLDVSVYTLIIDVHFIDTFPTLPSFGFFSSSCTNKDTIFC